MMGMIGGMNDSHVCCGCQHGLYLYPSAPTRMRVCDRLHPRVPAHDSHEAEAGFFPRFTAAIAAIAAGIYPMMF